jgi:phage terminase large subunit-like protein
MGRPVVLRDWQRAEILRIYDNPAGTRRAIVSFGRKNGKTSFAAMLLLAHLCGPQARANSQLYSAAQSRDQAAIIFALAAKMVRLSPDLNSVVTIGDTAKRLSCPELGTVYRALSAEAKTAYGLSPVFIVHDELGQVRGPRSELYEALETATAAQENPLSVVISTQAATDNDLLSVLIDDAKAGHDPRVVLSLYTADEELDPFGDEAIRQANPAFGDFQSADEVRSMAEDARRMPSREAEYRNLILNQRVEVQSPFIPISDWNACGDEPADFGRADVFGGLDLSSVRDLTALVLIARIDGVWSVKPTFWLPKEGLREKARRDGVPYDMWHSQGLLNAAPGASIDYEHVAEHLRGVFDAYNIKQIGFDRKFMEFLRPWLLRVGFSEEEFTERFKEFGQGWVSMTPALRILESEIANRRLAHGGNPILRMCCLNAVVKGKENAKTLDKRHEKNRIDGMVALTMAFGTAAPFIENKRDWRTLIF